MTAKESTKVADWDSYDVIYDLSVHRGNCLLDWRFWTDTWSSLTFLKHRKTSCQSVDWGNIQVLFVAQYIRRVGCKEQKVFWRRLLAQILRWTRIAGGAVECSVGSAAKLPPESPHIVCPSCAKTPTPASHFIVVAGFPGAWGTGICVPNLLPKILHSPSLLPTPLCPPCLLRAYFLTSVFRERYCMRNILTPFQAEMYIFFWFGM